MQKDCSSGYEFTVPGFRTPPYGFDKPSLGDGLKPTVFTRTPSYEWPAASPPYPYQQQEAEESAFRTPKRLEYKFDPMSEETGFEQRMQDPSTWHGPMLDFSAITNDGSAILSAMPLFVPPGCPNPYQGALFDTQQESAMTDKPQMLSDQAMNMQDKPQLLDSVQLQQGVQQLQHQHQQSDQLKKFHDLGHTQAQVQVQNKQQAVPQQQQVYVFEAPQVAATPITLPESKQQQLQQSQSSSVSSQNQSGFTDVPMSALEPELMSQDSQTEPVASQQASNIGKKTKAKAKGRVNPTVVKYATAVRGMLQKLTDEMDLSGTLSSIAGLPVFLEKDPETGEACLGKYTLSQRKLRIAKFKAKFAGRRPTGPRKKFLYASRSRFAKSRKRSGGRFVSKGNASPGDGDDD